jgi:cation transport regulator
MPYQFNEDLPSSVRLHLPEGAQDIHHAAFNSAFDSHGVDPRQEEIAHRVAWAAVKRTYVKKGDDLSAPERREQLNRVTFAGSRNVSMTLRQPAFEFKLGFPAFGLAG